MLAFEPGENFKPRGKPPRAWTALLERLQGHYVSLLYCVIAGLMLMVPRIVGPTFSSMFIDNILLEHRTSWARPLLVAMGITLFIQGTLKLLELTHLKRLRIALTARMTSHFIWHLLRLPIPFYAQRYPGEIGNRAQLNEHAAGVMSGQLATACIDVATMLFFVTVMAFYDVWLTAIGVVLSFANIMVLRWVSSSREEANQRLASESGRSAGVAIATLENMESIKASGLELEKFAQWAGQYARGSNAETELEQSSLALGVLPWFASSLTTMLILVVGGLRVIAGEMTIGELVAFQMLMESFLHPIQSLVEMGSAMQELQSNLLRLDDVLENPIAPDCVTMTGVSRQPALGTEATTPNLAAFRLQGDIKLSEVSFGYSPLEPPLIEDFELHLKPGSSVAFIGGSGSGKSTLSKLISGLYPIWSGQVLFDDRPREELSRAVLASSIGMVDQEPSLLEGTVRDNLTLWDRSIPEEAIIRACQDAAIYDTVLELPQGLDTVLTEGGSTLSGGQRQRLEIARALIRNPSILILDEATSAMDSETERQINENLRRRGCTSIVVAHRLSTIRDCDEIILLERGKVVERGRHEELWEADGAYAELLKHDGT